MTTQKEPLLKRIKESRDADRELNSLPQDGMESDEYLRLNRIANEKAGKLPWIMR